MTNEPTKRTGSDRRVSDRRQNAVPVSLERRVIPDRRSGLDRRDEQKK